MNEIKRKNFKKALNPVNELMSIIFSCLYLLLGIVLLQIEETIGLSIMFILGGLVLIPFCVYNKKQNKIFRHIISLIEKQKCYSLDRIGQGIGLDYSKIRTSIQKLIDNGFYEKAYINDTERCIVFPAANGKELNLEEKTVICSTCGAKNIVNSNVSKCEYCETILN